MGLKGVLCASECALLLYITLWFLRLFNILGSEYDLLIRWVSAIGLILLGIFMGTLISENKIQIRPIITVTILFSTGFFAAPVVAAGMLMLTSNFPFSRGMEPLIFGGSIVGYLLFYMVFWFWFNKRRNIFKSGFT